jgi:hypothetical protein
MSNKGKQHRKKWLITRLKTSGSKRRHVIDGDYSDTRHTKRNKKWEDLPMHQGMGKSFQFFNSKINYGLLVRFLRGKVGNNWQEVSKEIDERIPTDLSEYRDCVQWFVADLIEKRADGLWDKRTQKYLLLTPDTPVDWGHYTFKEFYVDPETQALVRIKEFPSGRATKGMDAEQLRKYREDQQKSKREEKKALQSQKEKTAAQVKDLLKNKNDL